MATIFDLPEDLLGQILARVPLTSLSAVRRTCKNWNALSKYQIFGKAAAAESKKQSLGFMVMEYRVFSMKLDLQGIRNDDLVDLSIKKIDILNQVEIFNAFHCDGLLLCVRKDYWRLLVWNPYLGQTRWIRPRNKFHRLETFALGYDDSKNRNYKILRFMDDAYIIDGRKKLLFWYEIYDFSSNSWRGLDVNPDWIIPFIGNGVSLKGNTYIFAREKVNGGEIVSEVEQFLLCFDFTRERFGRRLPLPFHHSDDAHVSENMALSCVRDEQLAVLYQHYETFEMMEIWITTKIEPNTVSWSKFLKVDMTSLNGIPKYFEAWNFLIDEEKKVAVVFDLCLYKPNKTCCYIIGGDGYFKSVKFREAPDLGKADEYGYYTPFVCSSYVPSLVQLQIKQRPKRKQRD